MSRLDIAYAVLMLMAWPVCSGMMFSDLQSVYDAKNPYSLAYAREHERKDAWLSVTIGAFYAAGWPIGLAAAYCVSGFNEHGLWQSAEKQAGKPR